MSVVLIEDQNSWSQDDGYVCTIANDAHTEHITTPCEESKTEIAERCSTIFFVIPLTVFPATLNAKEDGSQVFNTEFSKAVHLYLKCLFYFSEDHV